VQQQQHYRHTHVREPSASPPSSIVGCPLLSFVAVAGLAIIDDEYEEVSFLLSTAEELFGDLFDLLIRLRDEKDETGSIQCD
jgi:hypothetical protein